MVEALSQRQGWPEGAKEETMLRKPLMWAILNIALLLFWCWWEMKMRGG